MNNVNMTAEIWNEFSEQIRNYLAGKVRSKEDADDLTQDIFIKIQKNLGSLRDEKKLAPWIHLIVKNSLTDYYRSKGKSPEVRLDEEYTPGSGEAENIYRHINKCLRIFINRLPDKYRQPLIMSDLDGMKQKDVAKEMELSYSGLKSRVQRGREMIKEMFIECSCYAHDEDGKPIGEFLGSEDCEICKPEGC